MNTEEKFGLILSIIGIKGVFLFVRALKINPTFRNYMGVGLSAYLFIVACLLFMIPEKDIHKNPP